MIPKEIIKFLDNPGGHSLIIKGAPGSGKTTFALEILNQLSKKYPIKYVSTRVADETLFLQFPWLEEILQKKVKVAEKKMSRDELNRLEGIVEEGMLEEKLRIEDEEALLEVGSLLPEIDDIYDFVEVTLPEKALVCVDSIDGLSEKYGIPAEKILYTLQKDIVEKAHVNVIFILENSGFENIEYLGDGVISLSHEPWNTSWKRVMYIQKLRGSPILSSRYIYTLYNGHFRALIYTPFTLDSLHKKDLKELREYLHKILDYRVVNIIMDPQFPVELLGATILAIMNNLKSIPMLLPPSAYPGDIIKALAKKLFQKEVRIAGFGSHEADVVLEGRDMLIELSQDIIAYHIGKNSAVLLGIDTLGDLYENLGDLPRLVENLKRDNRVILLSPLNYPKIRSNAGVEKVVELVMMDHLPVIKDSEGTYAIVRDSTGLHLVPLM